MKSLDGKKNLATTKDQIEVEKFAEFFKHYMNVSAIVAAALPIPVTSFKLIPTFASNTQTLSVYTSLFCFLIFSFVFYCRHGIAKWAYQDEKSTATPEGLRRISVGDKRLFIFSAWVRDRDTKRFIINSLPLIFIINSISCVFLYHNELDANIYALISQHIIPRSTSYDSNVLQHSEYLTVLNSYEPLNNAKLMLLYLGIFASAEAAFVLMALREYLVRRLYLNDMGDQIAVALETAPASDSR